MNLPAYRYWLQTYVRSLLRIVVGLSIAYGAAFALAPAWPKPEGFVLDLTGSLDRSYRESLEAAAVELRDKTSVQCILVVLDHIADFGFSSIEESAWFLYREWNLGRDNHDQSIVFLVDRAGKKWALHLGKEIGNLVSVEKILETHRQILSSQSSTNEFGNNLRLIGFSLFNAIARAKGVRLDQVNRVYPPDETNLPEGESEHRSIPLQTFSTLLPLLFVVVAYLLLANNPRWYFLSLFLGRRSHRRYWNTGSHFGGPIGYARPGDSGCIGGFGGCLTDSENRSGNW